jgi:hypothetical protein
LLDENRLAVVARQHGIKKAKDSDSIGKLFAAYLHRVEESALGGLLVEITILHAATRDIPLPRSATVIRIRSSPDADRLSRTLNRSSPPVRIGISGNWEPSARWIGLGQSQCPKTPYFDRNDGTVVSSKAQTDVDERNGNN